MQANYKKLVDLTKKLKKQGISKEYKDYLIVDKELSLIMKKNNIK